MSQHILIVDDDPTQRRLLEGVLTKQGFTCVTKEGGEPALDFLGLDEGSKIDLVLLDLIMPAMDGIEVLQKLRPLRPNLPVIVLTSKGGVETVVSAMKAGATDFVVKPASPERLNVSITNAMQMKQLSGEVSRLRRKQEGAMTFDDLIANSPALQQVVRLGQRAAQSNIPILIEGESGVGKELIARAIQGCSDRAGQPFVTVNCGAIPENLVESILFGHEKGAFTGAGEKHVGKFAEANNGTLFLDEIGELRLDMQVKLLRALQEGEVDPVGAKKPTKIDIRLISATNRNLLEMAQTGDFREDLYYRLNVFPIWIPPLRDRMDDIPDLVSHFVQRLASEEGKRVLGIEDKALDMLGRYHWPGNVRQLENAVFRAVVLCDQDYLRPHDFPQIASFTGDDISQSYAVPSIEAEAEAETIQVHPFAGLPDPVTVTPSSGDDVAGIEGRLSPQHEELAKTLGLDAIEIFTQDGHLKALEDIEGDLIRLAIDKYSGQMSEVARRLGIGRSTLYRKVRDLGLDVRGTGTDD